MKSESQERKEKNDAKKWQLLLCVNTTGLHSRNPLRVGKTYVFALDPTCSCGKGDRLICVEGIHWYKNRIGKRVAQRCIVCRRVLPHGDYIAFIAKRFIPINDPDAKPDQLERIKETADEA